MDTRRWVSISILSLLIMFSGGLFQGVLAASVMLVPIAGNLVQPVFITHAGDGSGRLFIVEKQGLIKIYLNGAVLPVPFLDVSGNIATAGEQGLLSMAFPADFTSKRYFYIYYTNLEGNNVVSRYNLSVDDNIADPASEEIILTFLHPTFTNHNGGQLAFGPLDGYLYIGTGDGGGAGDPNGNSQNTLSLLGKILRIDVESGPGLATPYRIPTDNPFVGLAGFREEIWALGVRNPWRFSFDRATGDLYIGDVGQGTFEEINFQDAAGAGGANYGWNIFEGPSCFNPPAGCVEPADYSAPVFFYDHTVGLSVTGGYVYRGAKYPVWQGLYIYADFVSGIIWGLRNNGAGWTNSLLLDAGFSIATFGEDEDGNLYVGDFTNGVVYSIRRVPVLAPVYELLLLN